ncbi:MAG: YCF48-related protein [Paludibacter sp.]|nr:YCF48-related protein [Paludibacter sp.]
MALFYPDILEHNNPANPLMNDGQLAGGLQVVDDKFARNAIGEEKRKIGSTVSWSELNIIEIRKFVGPDTTDAEWINDLNWENVMFPFQEENVIEILGANATTVIPIGDKTVYSSFVLRYQFIRDTVIAMGTIEVMHNGSELETPVSFSLREFNGLIGLVGITSAFNSNEVEISIQIDNSSATSVIMVYDIQRKSSTHQVQWYEQTSPVAQGIIHGISFIDSVNGWAVGKNGITNAPLILHTADAGANWVEQTSSIVGSGTLYGVSFIDANTGWAVGIDSLTALIVLVTVDGGANWTRQTVIGSTPSRLFSVDFVDSNNGCAVGDDNGDSAVNRIITTTDGGTNWVEQTPPVVTGLLNGVKFIDSMNGWAVGTDGSTNIVILHTTDGGANWTPQTSPVVSGELKGVDFVDANHGWAVGTSAGNVIILTTADGGANWTTQTSPVTDNILYAVDFIDINNGWAIGSDASTNNILIKTVNGGVTWTVDNTLPSTLSPQSLRGISFTSIFNGCIGGFSNAADIAIFKYM